MSYLVRQMGYVVVATPHVAACASDIADILGLHTTVRGENFVLMSSNTRQCDVAYIQSSAPGIRAVGLEAMDAASVDEVMRRAKSENLAILSDRPSIPGVERAVRFRTPFGPIFEVHTPSPRNAGEVRTRPPIRAKRLDHVNLRVNDPRGFHDLLTTMLGMRLSDRTEDFRRAWYRGADGFHHTVAAGVGEGLHHYGFDAHSVLDLVGVGDTLVSKGRTLLWGIGHHGPGDNIFSYYIDPNGCVVETSFGMEHIDNDALREAGVWDSDYDKRVLDLWGSKPPPNYAAQLTPFTE